MTNMAARLAITWENTCNCRIIPKQALLPGHAHALLGITYGNSSIIKFNIFLIIYALVK